MLIDDPKKPEFASHDSYNIFARRVRRERRFATDAASRAFISTVLATAPIRHMSIDKDTILWRAQLDIEETESEEEDGSLRLDITGLGMERMIPKAEFVLGGRANPAGIAYLYLASNAQTAVSEVRPWIGVGVSLAQFQVRRNLRAIDLTKGHGEFGFAKLTFKQLFGEEPVDSDLKRRAVWTDIDSAFSRPVSRSEEMIDYIPTQVLSEAFREAGFEAVIYRSNFDGAADKPGYNIVLFDTTDAEILNCAPNRIKRVSVEFEECGNAWFSTRENENNFR